MKENTNIDNLFKGGLEDFEATPSEQVWEGVEGVLFHNVTPKPFYNKRIGLAALLIMLLAIGSWFLFFNHNPSGKQNPVKEIDKSNSLVTMPAVKKATETRVVKTKENSIKANQSSEALSTAGTTRPENSSDSPAGVNFKDAQTTTSYKNNSNSKADLIVQIPAISIQSLALMPEIRLPQQHHEVLTVTQYINKRSNLHIYTGAEAQVGMVYYPASRDQFTWAAGVLTGLKAGRFYFETGVGYRFMQEQGSYKIDFVTQDSVGFYNQVTSFDINPQNPDKIILNYKKSTIYDSIEHVAYTAPIFKYDYLTVPLKIGFRLVNRKNIFVALETGLEYSRLIKTFIPEAGFYYEGSNDVRIVNQTPQRVINNWKYLLSVRVGIKLTKSVSFIVQPEFGKYVNSVYQPGKGVAIVKPYMMNLHAGLYYDF